jgi:hypothetical protein
VDDILIIFYAANITAEAILEDHNAKNQKLKYKMETESNQRISFLDLSIYIRANEFTLGIYGEPTYTDTVIPESSDHPNNHKQAAFNCLLDRARKIPITNNERDKEIDQINAIATNNGCKQ